MLNLGKLIFGGNITSTEVSMFVDGVVFTVFFLFGQPFFDFNTFQIINTAFTNNINVNPLESQLDCFFVIIN